MASTREHFASKFEGITDRRPYVRPGFTAVATVETTVTAGPVVAFEITNLTGRVIARTVNASQANRAGAIGHAEKHLGDCYGIDAQGNRVEHVAHF